MKLVFPFGCLNGCPVFVCPALLEEAPSPVPPVLEELSMTEPALLAKGVDSPSGMADYGISSPWQQWPVHRVGAWLSQDQSESFIGCMCKYILGGCLGKALFFSWRCLTRNIWTQNSQWPSLYHMLAQTPGQDMLPAVFLASSKLILACTFKCVWAGFLSFVIQKS